MSNHTYQQSAAPQGGKHPVNILHLVMGVIFLGVVSIWALIEGQIATTDDLRWLIPLPWVIAGAAGLVVIMMSTGRDTAVSPRVDEGWSLTAQDSEEVPAPDYTSDLEARLEAESGAVQTEGEAAPETTDPEATPDR